MRTVLFLVLLLFCGCTNHLPDTQDPAGTSSGTESVVTFHLTDGDGWWTFPGEPPVYVNTGFPNADLVRTVTDSWSVGFAPGAAQFSPDGVDWDNADPQGGTNHWATVTATGSAFTVSVTKVPSGSG